MDSTTIIYILSLVVAVILPLGGVLAKDGAKLYRDVREALKDGRLSDDEIDLILADTGVVLRSIVRLMEKIFVKT